MNKLKLGETVRSGRKRFVINQQKWFRFEYGDGTRALGEVYCLTPIPKGMTAKDLGRKFEGAILVTRHRRIDAAGKPIKGSKNE